MRRVSRGEARRRAIELVVRIVAPATAALVLVAFLGTGAREPRHDLHLIAPRAARAGEALPIRAHVYAGLQRLEGPALATPEVRVELRVGAEIVASTMLAPAFAQTLEGSLPVPAGIAGQATLLARAGVDGEPAVVERPLAVTHEPPPPEPLVPRPLRALQSLAAGPVRPSAGATAPALFDVRVRGGACVPELPCEIVVHVGEPAAAIAVESTASVSASGGAAPSAETAGVVALEVTTHGPEAQLVLEARRANVVVATRAVRLPNALGAARLANVPAVLASPASPMPLLLGAEGGCIVDGFRDDRWRHTASLADCAHGAALPFAPLAPGRWRLQARTDPFSADAAAARAFYVRAPGESDADVLRALARAAIALDANDALARAVQADADAFTDALEAVAGALLAPLEADLHAQPTATSSLPAANARLAHERARLRTLTLAALALAALALGLLVASRGVRAAGEASRIMSEAGSLHPPSRAIGVMRAVAAGVSLVIVFAAIAVYLMARGGE